jgi:hypothetical protein
MVSKVVGVKLADAMDLKTSHPIELHNAEAFDRNVQMPKELNQPHKQQLLVRRCPKPKC